MKNNTHCVCNPESFPFDCKRHCIKKGKRKHEHCKLNTPAGVKYWNAWERGELGATTPPDPVELVGQPYNPGVNRTHRPLVHRRTMLSHPVRNPKYINKDCINLLPVVGSEPCSCGSASKVDFHGCKNPDIKHCVPTKARHSKVKDQDARRYLMCCEVCNKYQREPIKPEPFTDKPRLTLLCHCWPNGEAWKKHVEYLRPVQGVFDRKVMAIATGPGTAKVAEVKNAFGDSWEYLELENDPKQREVLSYDIMFPMVESTDINDVTFCIHTKGTQGSTSDNPQIEWWIRAMYQTVVHNWRGVLNEFEKGYSIVGSFRRYGSHFRTRYNWHYSGTFYAFRNAAAFSGGVPPIEKKWWGTESWPGQHFSREESACIFADNCGDIYKPNSELEQALTDWRKQNEN